MKTDVMVIRHSSGASHLLREPARPVVNAGDGMHEHPTQALLDAFTIRQQGATGGPDVAIVGDSAQPGRRSDSTADQMGAEVCAAGRRR